MKTHYAFTADHLRNLPPNLRTVIGKYFADSRWLQTCSFYNRMSERYRRTICFHAALRGNLCVYQLQEMDEVARERIVNALSELQRAFSKPRFRPSEQCPGKNLGMLSISERRTLYFHAGLTSREFDQPLRRIEEPDCVWRQALYNATGELHELFADAPEILTSIKPETY
ncbi:hypothetical protein [Musicola paradisiaca]|uniref:Replication gene B protein (GpB) n=1 Tax=Musicola paradisiaca (strain Ech703) TaxID=579405 RepID=C6C6X6_MUSP7|nr:hypothetical protein [Musicola paradisiaca]ACS85870.1 replication gene B protein (GpB) [Musicola paradisiaca Ech703]